MNIKQLLGAAGCAVLLPIVFFICAGTVVLGLLIESPAFPAWGRQQAWDWMKGIGQPVIPLPSAVPFVTGGGEWCATKVYLESPQESHLNQARVQGYVRNEYGQPLAGVSMHVSWDGDDGGITLTTDANGRYEFDLSPGVFHVEVLSGTSQRVSFRTDMWQYRGHYTWDVDFEEGSCSSDDVGYLDNPNAPTGYPLSGRITAHFHDPDYFRQFGQTHEGIDISVPVGTPIRSTMAGKVVMVGLNGGLGNMVKIQNGPYEIILGHLSDFAVHLGEVVSVGQLIGLSGGRPGAPGAGNSTGAHLHYEIHVNGMPVDPENYSH